MITDKIGYIICETETVSDPRTKIVSEGRNGKLVAEGVLQTADELNRNRRIYPKAELFPQLKAPRTIELLEAGYLRAELGHPLDKDLTRQQTINDQLTCAKFLELWTVSDDIWGRFVGTNNEYGRVFNEDLKDGCKPAWSLRALGSIVQTKRGAEVRNLRIITWDQVIYPSHPGAYTQRIVGVAENAILNERTEVINRAIQAGNGDEDIIVPITNESVINYIKSESANLKYMRESFDFMYNKIDVSKNGSTVTLTADDGNIFVVNLETYIHNDIMNYCSEVNRFFS